MDGKTKIELDDATARKFEIFCRITQELDGYNWKLTQVQKHKDRQAIIFLHIIRKDLTLS
jgi:hypothetical protein